MKIGIECRFSGKILFTREAENNTLMLTVQAAVHARANLAGANLDGVNLACANLTGAYLDGANLARANLARANLTGANLDGANLDGANLARANLDGANLYGAYLTGANLGGAKLLGDSPILQIGPIGSRCAYLVAYITDAGIKIQAGCFFGTLAEFSAAVNKTHGEERHGVEYRAVITMIQTHADIWTPADNIKAQS